ncbi:hypothetical protein Pelo_17873 [Pelomyxa schiedti]|nr:hypothetical protein Pelo_17873 [Pelomyxa schiedti]
MMHDGNDNSEEPTTSTRREAVMREVMVDTRWARSERDLRALVDAGRTQPYLWDPEVTLAAQIPTEMQCHDADVNTLFTTVIGHCGRVESGKVGSFFVPYTVERFMFLPPDTVLLAFHFAGEMQDAHMALQRCNYICHQVTANNLKEKNLPVENNPFHCRIAKMDLAELEQYCKLRNLQSPKDRESLWYWKRVLLTLIIIWRDLASDDPGLYLLMVEREPNAGFIPALPPKFMDYYAKSLRFIHKHMSKFWEIFKVAWKHCQGLPKVGLQPGRMGAIDFIITPNRDLVAMVEYWIAHSFKELVEPENPFTQYFSRKKAPKLAYLLMQTTAYNCCGGATVDFTPGQKMKLTGNADNDHVSYSERNITFPCGHEPSPIISAWASLHPLQPAPPRIVWAHEQMVALCSAVFLPRCGHISPVRHVAPATLAHIGRWVLHRTATLAVQLNYGWRYGGDLSMAFGVSRTGGVLVPLCQRPVDGWWCTWLSGQVALVAPRDTSCNQKTSCLRVVNCGGDVEEEVCQLEYHEKGWPWYVCNGKWALQCGGGLRVWPVPVRADVGEADSRSGSTKWVVGKRRRILQADTRFTCVDFVNHRADLAAVWVVCRERESVVVINIKQSYNRKKLCIQGSFPGIGEGLVKKLLCSEKYPAIGIMRHRPGQQPAQYDVRSLNPRKVLRNCQVEPLKVDMRHFVEVTPSIHNGLDVALFSTDEDFVEPHNVFHLNYDPARVLSMLGASGFVAFLVAGHGGGGGDDGGQHTHVDIIDCSSGKVVVSLPVHPNFQVGSFQFHAL